jgi:hypothetical protein
MFTGITGITGSLLNVHASPSTDDQVKFWQKCDRGQQVEYATVIQLQNLNEQVQVLQAGLIMVCLTTLIMLFLFKRALKKLRRS